jgi:hypothetical protein
MGGGLSLCSSRQTEQQKKHDEALALGGCGFTFKTNNQPIFRGSGKWNDIGCVGGVGRMGGHPVIKNN